MAKHQHDSITPYGVTEESKKQQVIQMFDNIAPSYDLLNHALSMGIDILWRKKAIRLLKKYNPQIIVDIATGTGDFALEAVALKPQQIIGIDISPMMLEKGREKIAKKDLSPLIDMRIGDSENLKLETESVDAITVGFGVRNFQHLEKGLAEMHRVLKPEGAITILEPSYPTRFPLKQLFHLHFKVITPWLGKLLSGDNAAYEYLPESVKAFPNGEAFLEICRRQGFKRSKFIPLTFGICSLYLLQK